MHVLLTRRFMLWMVDPTFVTVLPLLSRPGAFDSGAKPFEPPPSKSVASALRRLANAFFQVKCASQDRTGVTVWLGRQRLFTGEIAQ